MNVDEDTLRRIIRDEMNGLENKFDTRFDKMDARFDSFELKLAKFFGQTQRHFDTRFKKFERKFDKKSDRLQNTLDGLVKRMDHDDVERIGMNSQLDQHDTWIGELANHTNARLSTP